MVTIAESQACQAWDALVRLAARGGEPTITYSELAEALGAHERGLVPMLDLVMNHCRANGLPPLTGLVVLKDEGVPSGGFPFEELPKIPRVYTFDWKTLTNPFEYARDG